MSPLVDVEVALKDYCVFCIMSRYSQKQAATKKEAACFLVAASFWNLFPIQYENAYRY